LHYRKKTKEKDKRCKLLSPCSKLFALSPLQYQEKDKSKKIKMINLLSPALCP
jgi:hypothetical protein